MDTNYHHHDGVDSPQIDPANLLGFPVITSAPSDSAPNGTIRIYVDSTSAPTVWRLYIRAANTWKYKTIDNT